MFKSLHLAEICTFTSAFWLLQCCSKWAHYCWSATSNNSTVIIILMEDLYSAMESIYTEALICHPRWQLMSLIIKCNAWYYNNRFKTFTIKLINSPFDICEIKQQERFMKFEIEYYRVYICVCGFFSHLLFSHIFIFFVTVYSKRSFLHIIHVKKDCTAWCICVRCSVMLGWRSTWNSVFMLEVRFLTFFTCQN